VQKEQEPGKPGSNNLLEEDSFLAALVVESEIEPAVKAVFESGKAQEYVEKLDKHVLLKEQEIEDICNRNYQVR
jgi:hypothetical protein